MKIPELKNSGRAREFNQYDDIKKARIRYGCVCFDFSLNDFIFESLKNHQKTMSTQPK